MLVIGNRYVLIVPLGRTPKSCRITGGGLSGLPVKNLLAHGICLTGLSWAASGAARINRVQVQVRDFMVRQAPPGPPDPRRTGVHRLVRSGGGNGLRAIGETV